MTGDIHMLLGSYVLGGLSADDRRAFDEHLEGCARCRSELAEAAPLPALLRKVSGVPVLNALPPIAEPSLGTLLATARIRRRRQQTVRWLAAAAAVVIAFGVGSTTATPKDDAEGSPTFVLRASAGLTANGKVAITKKGWGTSIWLQLADMPRTGVFTLWATDDQGHSELAATWGATASGFCDLDGATSIPTDDLREVSVVGPDEAVVAVAPV
jgi:anti-sigma-K factor RskA